MKTVSVPAESTYGTARAGHGGSTAPVLSVEKQSTLAGLATTGVAASVFIMFVTWSIGFVPPNMDEFSPTYRLACRYPYAHLNGSGPFIITCQSHLIDYGLFVYHRAFEYIGITSSVLYFPFWWVWRSPYSYLLQGLLFLLAFSVLIVRALGLQWRYLLIPLCYFPLGYSLIHDTGPVRLSLLSYPLILLMLAKVFESPLMFRKLACAVMCALLMALCVEDKPFYLFLLPSIAVFVIAVRAYTSSVSSVVADISTNRVPLIVFAVVALASIAFLLFAGTTEGQTYFWYLKDAPEKTYRLGTQAKAAIAYTFSFPRYGHRVFDIPRLVELVSGVVTLLLASWTLVVGWRDQAIGRRTVSLFGLSYAAGVSVFLLVRTPWAGHHHVFLHVPILVLLVLIATTGRFVAVVGAVAFLNAASMAALGLSTINAKSSAERNQVFRFLSQHEIAKAHVINFSSFGGYYHQALFGDDMQLVTWSHSGRRNRDPAVALERLAEGTSRRIINVCRDCDADLMRRYFATDDVTEIDLRLREWKVFEIVPK